MNEMSNACCVKEERSLLERLGTSLNDTDKASERLETVLRRVRGKEICREPQCYEQGQPPTTGEAGQLAHFVQQAERNENHLRDIAREFEYLI